MSPPTYVTEEKQMIGGIKNPKLSSRTWQIWNSDPGNLTGVISLITESVRIPMVELVYLHLTHIY